MLYTPDKGVLLFVLPPLQGVIYGITIILCMQMIASTLTHIPNFCTQWEGNKRQVSQCEKLTRLLLRRLSKRLEMNGTSQNIFTLSWFRQNVTIFDVLTYVLGHTVDNLNDVQNDETLLIHPQGNGQPFKLVSTIYLTVEEELEGSFMFYNKDNS